MAEYIEKEAAIRVVFITDCESISLNDVIKMTGEVAEAIKRIPAADVAPVRHGQLVWHGDEEELHYACSCCGHKAYGNTLEIMDGTYRFCPNCGARMEET